MLTMYVKYKPSKKWNSVSSTWIWKTKECITFLFQNRIILSLKCLYFWQSITISEALLCKIRKLTYWHLAVPSGIGWFLSRHHILISPFFVWGLLVSKIWCLLQTTKLMCLLRKSFYLVATFISQTDYQCSVYFWYIWKLCNYL